jgi:signal transduction histidine kinase
VELKGVGDLQELSQSFNKMAQELSTTETLRSDFVNTFSHQFKTPLLAMQGFAELLEIGDLTACEQKEYAGIIVAESKRLAALATKTLMLSKYEHVEIITDKTSFRLDEQIRRTITSIEPQWLAKELDVSADLDEITMPGNEDLIQQIWLNLLDNAIKFSPQGGNIQLQLQQRSGKICFTIQDSGIGMSEQARAHCFDKFYQEDESHKTGNGLGLAIVKRIVDLHGGTVEVQSKPGQGSTFCVSL